MSCRFVSSTEPRIISGRHATPCVCDDREIGCLPCPEQHCVCCGKEHAKAACTGCLDAARSDLEAIGDLCASLPEEAVEKGVQSEAMMLLGPVADPAEWNRATTAAIFGQVHLEATGEAVRNLTAYLSDCRDEMHPGWILGTWEQVWRDFLDHQTETPVTTGSSWSYLKTQIGYMSEQNDPPFDEFARELRGCRAHLENVLHDGVRVERGAPCVQCEKPMTRGDDEHWHCHTCHRTVSEAEYRLAVGVTYRAHSPSLTATDMADRIGVKASIIRVWGSRGLIAKRGKNEDGLTLYDVASAITKRDATEQEKAG